MLDINQQLIKYPRTFHLPWSQGATNDDKVLKNTACFEGREIVITEKMDGENTTMYSDCIHARSLDSRSHPSQDWVRNLHATLKWQIPKGWRFCGENLFAKHSIKYENLLSYFQLFSVWDEDNQCLSWDNACEWADLLGLKTVPVFWRGIWDEGTVKAICDNLDTSIQEGVVVRLTSDFKYFNFSKSVAKYVRKNHVTSDIHWKHSEIERNGVK